MQPIQQTVSIPPSPFIDPDKIGILAAVCLAALILPLSFSGGAMATPAIGKDLGGSPLALNWITNAFMLSFGSLLMIAGALADAFGRKRLFIMGVAAFTVTSVLVIWVPNIFCLDILRAVQGVAAAAALAGGTAALAQEFEGMARTLAFSLLGSSFGIGLAFGPVLAGLLIALDGWRSVFLSSAAVGLFALLLGMARMRESRACGVLHFDWPGALSFTIMLGLFTWAVLQMPTKGWSSPETGGLLAGASAALFLFVAIERRARHPMLALSLFRYPRFIGVQMLPIATCYSYVVLLVLLPLRFVGIDGQSEIRAGLWMIALSIPMLVMPGIAAGLTRWLSAGKISAAGLLIAACGLFWLSEITVSTAPLSIMAPMLLIGIGTGLPWGLMDGLAVSVVPKERAGMATGIFSTTRVAGEGLAIALVSALLTFLIQCQLPGGVSAQTAVTAQYLVMGNLEAAMDSASGTAMDVLLQVYDEAFRWLIYVLIFITLASALIIGWLLGPRSEQEAEVSTGEWEGNRS
jgi:MFS family permease